MQGYSYFPSVVYRDERPDLVKGVQNICASYLDRVRSGPANIVQSEHLAKEPEANELANYILLSAVKILGDQGYDVGKYDFYLSGFWAQETLPGSSTNVHVHKNSQICGWFFIERPENGAYAVYHDTRMNKEMIELDTVQSKDVLFSTSSIFFDNLQEGTVLFGNSWMKHQLVGGSSSIPTKCVHFVVSHKERQCITC
jgi:hypothetical protein